jgi:SAM-dependent methyltransferase
VSDDERAFQAMANSFDGAAEVYERARPTYPSDAVEWLLASAPRTVLDIGAGTGKFTRLIAPRVETVIALDPSERMLRELSAVVPSAELRIGSAEAIPLSPASVDAVYSAQAWHWVDTARAVPEVLRVLRPGGVFGLIWNARDERVPWVKRLSEVMHNSKAEEYLADPAVPDDFGAVERFESSWEAPFDRESLLELVASRSYYLTADEAQQRETLEAVNRFLDTEADLGDDWRMPYRTIAFRMTRANRESRLRPPD